ncbi:hypothetical protein [Mycobacterium heckeshornense]|uniref:Uncharacterized protein n=1 Tax=Mycobacterium heckeshornense TaxID=110505 RepID=A0A7R7JJR6_9MYCO|nr:hypothetical protein [Mycobacterium heckeshornense]MCV7035350.1 hypothetical protein [Mycobacterium heckeshornense]BCO38062.1 hypothetical protein MHEC_44950 [Mycobacterium heckeshornense]
MSRGRGGFSYPVPALATHRTSAAELPVPRAHRSGHVGLVNGTPWTV